MNRVGASLAWVVSHSTCSTDNYTTRTASWASSNDTISSSEPVSTSPVIARYEFIADAPKPGTGGTSRLVVNGKNVAEGRSEHTVPGRFSGYACMDIGTDKRAPVSPMYNSEGDERWNQVSRA